MRRTARYAADPNAEGIGPAFSLASDKPAQDDGAG